MSHTMTADPRSAELVRQAATWPLKAKTLEIVDQETLNSAGEELFAVRALLEEAHARFDPICDANYNAWQVALRERKTVIEPLEQAEKLYKLGIAQWTLAQQERQRDEQRRLEAESLARAAVQLEADIEHAEAQGATSAEIESMVDRPLQPAPVVAAPIMRAPAGISKPRDNWKGEITGKRVLVEFIAANKRWDLLALLTCDTTACNQMAKSIKNAAAIPGVRFWNDPNIAVRRA